MPTYEYRCVSCEHQFERFQRMSDEPVKECEVCGEPVKRLLFPVAIHFKGSGFYSTDYSNKSKISTTRGGSSGASDSSDSSSSSTSDCPSSATETKSDAAKAVSSATKND